jgi:OOP family OmpA-OmpF porin
LDTRVPLLLALVALVPGCASTLAPSGTNAVYVRDGRDAVVNDPFNLCWRTGYWTPAATSADPAVAECDPGLAPRPKAPAPAVAPPAPVVPAQPIPVPAAPVPAPAPIAPPAKPKPVAAPARCDASITLQSDETFGFNSATLSSAARARIDKDVVARLQSCAAIDVILVTGHTDRVGTQQYNQALSLRRANAVKQHLVAKGVPATRIETVGMGKSAPIKFCPDTRNQKALAACLAPNRRVVVEIKGPGK